MTDLLWVLRGLEGFVLVLGAGIAAASLRAFRRTHRRSLLLLGIGFLLVTIAAALAGILYELVTHDLLSAWIVSAALNGAGFAVILFSIVAPELRRDAPGVPYPPGPRSDPDPPTPPGPPGAPGDPGERSP